MKKIISILLVIVCLGALFSCAEPVVDASNFQAAIDSTNPTKIIINTSTKDSNGELKGSFTITNNADGSSTIEYSYEKWLPIGEGDETKETVGPITVTRDKDGNYSDGGEFTGSAPTGAAGVKVNLTNITSEVKISADETTLTAVVAKAETKAVFGTAYDYDVSLTVVKGDAGIKSVTLDYVKGGTVGKIFCKYTQAAEEPKPEA